jgi:hypothetical protein
MDGFFVYTDSIALQIIWLDHQHRDLAKFVALVKVPRLHLTIATLTRRWVALVLALLDD